MLNARSGNGPLLAEAGCSRQAGAALRGTHATLLLDRGIPVHVVAERIGDDPAVLLRSYAKRKRKNVANNSVAAAIEALAAGYLKS